MHHIQLPNWYSLGTIDILNLHYWSWKLAVVANNTFTFCLCFVMLPPLSSSCRWPCCGCLATRCWPIHFALAMVKWRHGTLHYWFWILDELKKKPKMLMATIWKAMGCAMALFLILNLIVAFSEKFLHFQPLSYHCTCSSCLLDLVGLFFPWPCLKDP